MATRIPKPKAGGFKAPGPRRRIPTAASRTPRAPKPRGAPPPKPGVPKPLVGKLDKAIQNLQKAIVNSSTGKLGGIPINMGLVTKLERVQAGKAEMTPELQRLVRMLGG